MITRQHCFAQIKQALHANLQFANEHALVTYGDSAKLLQKLPDQSVSLILTDPPYHSTKKNNIYGDTAFSKDKDYIDWMEKYAQQWRRVLKPNGSLFCFCATAMSARLEVMLSKHFNVLSHIVWTKQNEPGFDGWKGKMKKEALRQWYAHSERIIFAEPAIDGNLGRCIFAQMLQNYRKQAGLSMHKLAAIVGAHGKVNHGGAVSNWESGRNVPSREQYHKIRQALLATGKIESMPPYEDAIRFFKVDAQKEFTDVWHFPSVRPYKGKHPAEKPATMLEHAIEATTYPGDIILDCFAGSGSTALAALKLKRRSISIEIERKWSNEITTRIQSLCRNNGEIYFPQNNISTHIPLKNSKTPQIELFEAKR